MTVEEFIGTYEERCFVWMLNECFYRHLEAQGLWVDKDRMRAYFPRTDEGPRRIKYQARLRRATRTVVKKRNSYWEHKSFWFRFERFGSVWTLVVLPSYVFTTDGRASLLQGDLVNRFSTKHQSRDYNNIIHNDLVFWTWVLSGEKSGTFALNTGFTNVQTPMISANKIRELGGPQIRIRSGLSATVARDFGDDAWGIEQSEKLDVNYEVDDVSVPGDFTEEFEKLGTKELKQLESEFTQTISQLEETEDVR